MINLPTKIVQSTFTDFSSTNNIRPNQIELFAAPNPTHDLIEFSCSEIIQELNVYDTKGQLINIIKPNTPIKNIELNCSEYTSGYYIVGVLTKEGVSYIRFGKL